MKTTQNGPEIAGGTESPELLIVWDPEIVGGDDYAALVTAVGDLVRASGGAGVERLNGHRLAVPTAGARR